MRDERRKMRDEKKKSYSLIGRRLKETDFRFFAARLLSAFVLRVRPV
jgi:hypothetical protein